MAKLEIPIVVDISEIESLIDEIKHLQTYKLSYGDEQILIDREDVIKIFAAHVRANIEPERKKGHWKNADRIRAMTDEGLAEWLVMIEKRVIEKAMSKPQYYTDEELKADWLDWLKQEVEE